MISDLDLCRGCSAPQVGLDEHFLEAICVEHARCITRLFVERCTAMGDRDIRGIVPFLAGSLHALDSFDLVWDTAFGTAHRALLMRSQSDVGAIAAALAFALHIRGVPGAWFLKLPVPVTLRFGCWLLPLADEITVEATERNVLIAVKASGKQRSAFFRRTRAEWTGEGSIRMPAARMGWLPIAVVHDYAPPGFEEEINLDMLQPVAARRLAVACRSAIKIIDQYAPIYSAWVRRVVRFIVPLYSQPGYLRSGSDSFLPGMISICHQSDPSMIAEMLVHEATHQYYYILARLGGVTDGSDQAIYYSPIKKTGRPLDKILLAYHAFANVEILSRLFIENGLKECHHARRNVVDLGKQLDEMEQFLRNSSTLTPIGRGLCEPLFDLRRKGISTWQA